MMNLMRTLACLIIAAVGTVTDAFTVHTTASNHGIRFATTSSTRMQMSEAATLPTVDQLSNDPFMKQVQYGAELSMALEGRSSQDEAKLGELLMAQLSHPDGIRGFFVSYLTFQGGGSAADQDTVPTILKDAMLQANLEELVPLACMNVVMPTGMKTMHEDAELQEQSALTASRGMKVLIALADASPKVKVNCDAISDVAKGKGDAADGKIKYWQEFFEKWGYKEEQRKDISDAMDSVLAKM